jgi:hypothetical protein
MSDYKFRCVRCQQEVNSGASMCPWCHANPFSGDDPVPLPARASEGVDGFSFFFFVGGFIYFISWNSFTEYLGLGMLGISALLLIRLINRLRNE